MFAGTTMSRSVAWAVEGRQFRLTPTAGKLALECSDGRIALTLYEWQGVAAALAALHPPPLPRDARGISIAPTAARRRPWRDDDDAALTRGWYGGEGLSVLAARLERSPGAITARLVRLDLVGTSAEAKRRP
jgi:hypothetical protein